ncbi:hypothetical protein, partial [Mycobacteroides abscessus]|uniref:hypothetical protein n=1 Tax=Mycobacteroides abscessus TaxID=36809 RepID=UPI0013FDD670
WIVAEANERSPIATKCLRIKREKMRTAYTYGLRGNFCIREIFVKFVQTLKLFALRATQFIAAFQLVVQFVARIIQ